MTIAAQIIAAASDGVFIDNDWRPSASGATIEVSDPARGEVFTRIAAGNAADIDAAVRAARRAREGAWGALAATERGRILSRAAQLVLGAFDELAATEARDTGKPIGQARADITAAARYLEFYGGATDKVHGDTIATLPGHFATTEYVPFGVTGHIIPWNYPAQMFGRTIAAALAMGNACVLKPAEDACLTPLRLTEILRDAGQTCSAGARLLVEDGIAEQVAERLRAGFPSLTAGVPQADHDLGPLISPKQLVRVCRFCDQADADGIPLIAEGRIGSAAPASGNFIAPRAYGPVPRDHPLARQEVFGPVLSLMTFRDEADAVALANDTEYGLVAGVWSRDGSRAIRVARQIMAGQVFVNAYGAGGGIELPFGGMKKSGHGREKGFDALYEFAATRTMVIRHD